jgi:hypothetical protein
LLFDCFIRFKYMCDLELTLGKISFLHFSPKKNSVSL